MNPQFDELRVLLAEVDDLRSAASLLHWDQATYMPTGGAAARGRQMATLSKLAHEKFTHPRVGELLQVLEPWEKEHARESFESSFVRVARRQYEKAVRVPGEFEARLSDHLSQAYTAWTTARPDNDWKRVEGHFCGTLDLSRELSSFFARAEGGHVADALIDFSDAGAAVATVRPLFARLREFLVPLANEVASRPVPRDDFLKRHACAEKQFAFGAQVARSFGYDFERGRQDATHHPFMTKFSLGDVRITTRAREDDWSEAFYSTLHETGHALYEQSIDMAFEGTPLADGASSGVHEAQSRLWENLVGRSLPFCKYLHPRLQEAFPSQFGDVNPDELYRAVNRAGRSLIRTDADEVFYNLHVMIRFELECALLEGSLDPRDLPEAWREKYRSDIGLAPSDDKDGCLQDVHWFGGTVGGAFQGYTLGNILAAQFFDSARQQNPDVHGQIERGEFAPLLGWLQQNVYRWGATFQPDELVRRATGSELSIDPYRKYLEEKFGGLYGL
jgi:carboxypeptidase Taq